MQDQTALKPELAATDVSESKLAEKLITGALLGGGGAVTLGWAWFLGWGGMHLVSYLVG